MANAIADKDLALLKSTEDIPIIHVRGTYFGVGYRVGRTFKSMIRELVETWAYFNDELLPKYQEPKGQEIYTNSLNLCNKKFPHYVEEIKGMAEGSDIDFYKLFLLNIDSMITSDTTTNECGGVNCIRNEQAVESGCTSIICNKDEIVLGHTEDAMTEICDHVYLISAEILSEKGEILEKFTSLSYAGHLPGYTMGYNHYGKVYTINTLFPIVNTSGTPRAFIARALLSSASLKQTINILEDAGTGVSDGFSLNLCLRHKKYPGYYEFFNIEITPPVGNSDRSKLHIVEVKRGESHVHCNKYLRMKAVEPEFPMSCSSARHDTIENSYKKINGLEDVKLVLSDQSNAEYPVYICKKVNQSFIKTVAVGIFDLKKNTLSIYMNPPSNSSPLAVIKMFEDTN